MKITHIATWHMIALLALASLNPHRACAETTLNGAGATFPYPIYSKWFDEYHIAHPEIQINYQSIGSGGGIRQFTEKTVDFGATDAPMNEKQLTSVQGTPLHIPTVLGAVVPAFNVVGITELNFTGEVLANIFLGKIKTWNDPAIKALNPAAQLPNQPINVIRRSDGSGTTYCWSDYLSKVNAEWKSRVGTGVSVNWPAGLGAKGNEGVSGMIKQIKGSIGYLELAYAEENKISYGAVKNAAGNFVKANIASISAAAEGVKIPDDFRVSITNAPGKDAYPIATFTWLLIYEKNQGEVGKVLKDLLQWVTEDGQKYTAALHFAPLPKTVQQMIKTKISTIQ